MKTLSNVYLNGATILSRSQLKLVRGGEWVVMEHIKIGHNHFESSLGNCQVIGSCAGEKDRNYWSVRYCKDDYTVQKAQSELMMTYSGQGAKYECF